MDIELTGNYPIIIAGKETGQLDVRRDGLFWCFEATSEMTDGIIRLSVFGEGGEGYLGVMEPKEGGLQLKKKLSRSGLGGFPATITHAGKQGEPQMITAAPVIEAQPEPQVYEAPPAPTEVVSAPENGEGEAETEDENAEAPPEFGRSPPEEIEPYPEEFKPEPEPEPESESEPKPEPEPEQQTVEPAPQADIPKPEPEPQVVDSEPEPRPLVWKMCGCPASYISSLEGKSIFGDQGNTLEASDGEFVYLALPEKNANFYSPHQQRFFSEKAHIMGEPYLICKIKNGRII